MTPITFPLMVVIDDSRAIVAGATVTIASVTTKAGTAIPSHGAVLNLGADPFISVDYSPEDKAEAVLTLAISKVGSTITGLNAAPRFFLAKDSGRVVTNLDAPVSGVPAAVATAVGSAIASGTVAGTPASALSFTLSGLPAGVPAAAYVGRRAYAQNDANLAGFGFVIATATGAPSALAITIASGAAAPTLAPAVGTIYEIAP